MTYKTRKRIWPVALMSLAVFGLLAAALALSVAQTPAAQADGCGDGERPAGESQLECLLRHGAEGSNPDEDHEHAPGDPNQAPVLTGTALGDVSLRIRQSTDPIDVSVAFEDPDADDTLTFSASSDNTAVANASVAGSQMTVVAGNVRGTARITVTADDGNGGTVSTSFTVTVSEDYTLTAAEPNGDPDLVLPEPGDPDVYERLRDIPLEAIYLAGGAFDAHFTLAVAGSADDVTVTITASEIIDITIEDSDGLIGAGFVDEEETDLEGSLTVKSTDQGSRAFEIEGMCEAPGGWALIEVEDKDLDLVAEGAIYCPRAPDPPDPDPDEFRSDVMTVVSYNDWDHWEMYETVSDGYLIDDPDNNVDHMVNQSNNKMGVLVRDEPVVDNYQLAISAKEMLTLKAREDANPPNEDPDPNRLTKKEAEEGQHTIEVMVGTDNVQLTVTSTMAGPAYVRFLNSDMRPFDTDIDEEPAWRGAQVKGLDEGRLELNMEDGDDDVGEGVELSAAKALAFDQYQVVIPGVATGNAYLHGQAGTYYQGTFRFFNPCPSEGHHFYVEVYENQGKYLKTTEKVMCVGALGIGPTGLEFTIDSDLPGEGVLRFRPSQNAVSHTVLLIDATTEEDSPANRNIVYSVPVENPVRPLTTVEFNERVNRELNNGWTYHIVVIAEGADGQYEASAVKNYSVEWVDEPKVSMSTDSPNTGDGHALCGVENDEITALLSNCDTNTAPMAPTATLAAQTVMAGDTAMVQSTITDADMGDMLTWSVMSDMMMYATASVDNMGMVTIMGVAAGSATVTVTATDMHGETAQQTIMVTVTAAMLGKPTNVMATVDDSDPASANVTVTWTNGMNADGHEVGLVDLSDYSVRDHRVTDGATSHTFTNVASGRYMAIVVSTMDTDFEYDVAIVTVP